MKNINKFFSEIEDVVYSSKNKQEADDIINNYQKLFNTVNFNDYKLAFQKTSQKIIIKHKAFANKIYLYYLNKNFYLDNNPIELNLIEKTIENYFINLLDKK